MPDTWFFIWKCLFGFLFLWYLGKAVFPPCNSILTLSIYVYVHVYILGPFYRSRFLYGFFKVCIVSWLPHIPWSTQSSHFLPHSVFPLPLFAFSLHITWVPHPFPWPTPFYLSAWYVFSSLSTHPTFQIKHPHMRENSQHLSFCLSATSLSIHKFPNKHGFLWL